MTAPAFPRPSESARLFAPAGADGPAFLLIRNFKVIKHYNNADAYAYGQQRQQYYYYGERGYGERGYGPPPQYYQPRSYYQPRNFFTYQD